MKPYVLIKDSQNGIESISVMGGLDLASAHEFESAMDGFSDTASAVLIDMCACSYIDSTILAVLIRASQRFGKKFILVIPKESTLRRLFQIVNLESVMPIESSIEAARARILIAQ